MRVPEAVLFEHPTAIINFEINKYSKSFPVRIPFTSGFSYSKNKTASLLYYNFNDSSRGNIPKYS